jgi:hypothetical protein
VYWIVLLIFIGVFFWLANLKILLLTRDWPLLLVFLGLINLLQVNKPDKKKSIIKDLEKGKINAHQAEEKLRSLK